MGLRGKSRGHAALFIRTASQTKTLQPEKEGPA